MSSSVLIQMQRPNLEHTHIHAHTLKLNVIVLQLSIINSYSDIAFLSREDSISTLPRMHGRHVALLFSTSSSLITAPLRSFPSHPHIYPILSSFYLLHLLTRCFLPPSSLKTECEGNNRKVNKVSNLLSVYKTHG